MSGVKHTPWEVEDFGWPEYLDGIRSRYAVRNESGEPIAYAFDADEARLFASAPDLLEALIEARLTLSLTRTNIMVEMKKSEGAAYRWEGVPELLANRIAQCDAAIARARGEQDGGGE